MARMNNEQTIEISIQPLTAKGNPAPIDGNAGFTADPADAGSFEQLSDTSARFTPATGFTGAVQIVVSADAEMDEGVRTITASGALEVLAVEADHFEVSFADPV
jgi:hypothetical protein